MTWHLLQRWHRRFGIVIAVIVLLLIVTGILLNHTSDLKLGQRYISADWLLDWYEIKPDQPARSYSVDGNVITRMGDRLYYHDREIRESVQRLHGAVLYEDMQVVGYDSHLLLLDGQGQVIEQLDGMDGVPSGMQQIGLDDNGQIIIRAAHGDYRLDLESIHWEEEDEIMADWSVPVTISPGLNRTILNQYRGHGLPLERVLLDLHSGRILGQWGVYLMDLVAILLFVLAITGTWMWFQRLK